MRKLVAILLAASALTGVAYDAVAKGTKPARPRLHFGPGIQHGQPAPANVLSRSELRWCVQKQGPIDSMEAALAAEEANLDARAETVDNYSQASVDAYNALAQAFNARADAHNASIEDWNSRCAERWYYVSDMEAVRGK